MRRQQSKEKVKLWQSKNLAANHLPIQLMRATYQQQVFPKHSHEGFGIGVIEHGALGFFYRGEQLVASQGVVNLVNPDEIHTGQAVTHCGWCYRMFYFDAQLMQDISMQLGAKPGLIPFFKMGVIQDPLLAKALHELHCLAEQVNNGILNKLPNTTSKVSNYSTTSMYPMLLELQIRFFCLMEYLIIKYADMRLSALKISSAPKSIARVIDYIQSYSDKEISIKQLAAIAHLSPYHLIRMFGRQVGMAPHAYLMQTRLNKAKQMIMSNYSLTESAQQAGFTDQSHMSRNFRRILGYTPGQLRNSVQY